MPESERTPSENPTPHVLYASEYPTRPWRESFPHPEPPINKAEQIRAIRETLKRAG